MVSNSIKQSNFLYVEDDESNRRVMELFLQKTVSVKSLTIFEDSTNFMERVKELPSPLDVALLDIHVQPHNGFEMLKMLRADPLYKNTKAIALTASVTNEEVEQLRSAGFDGGIGKPLRVSTFPDLLAQILEGKTIWHVT